MSTCWRLQSQRKVNFRTLGTNNLVVQAERPCDRVHVCTSVVNRSFLFAPTIVGPKNSRLETLRRNPIENRAISGFSGQKSVPE